jgi:hypothetical protein
LEVAAATMASADVDNAGYAVEREGGVTPTVAEVFEGAWFNRMTSSFITMGIIVLTARAAAMMPIRETVFANRLRR